MISDQFVKKITDPDGRFLSIGSLAWDTNPGHFYTQTKNYDPINHEINYPVLVWDLTKIYRAKYIYLDDDDSNHYHATFTFKPCLAQSMINYLDSEDRNTLTELCYKAYNKMREYCEKRFFHSFLLISPVGYQVGLHRHWPSVKFPTTTFTYVVQNQATKVKNSLLTERSDGQIQEVPFPDADEFFFVHDSTRRHGTYRKSDDKNTYLYFTFDGVTLKDNRLQQHQIYVDLPKFL